ncbi:hypothetical protein [Streptomyces sp. NPDC088674]|uniref:hypothetical protein n=1 Tax=Streptomyces sp. NPDC088674 TaxID=3365869 RepID=UPI003824991D
MSESEKVLVARTHAIDEQGRAQHFSPGESVPAWARAQLTNPKLWGVSSAKPEALAGVPVPARSGPGSGKEAWAAFAEKHGVTLDGGMSRDDIMAACERAGVLEPEE